MPDKLDMGLCLSGGGYRAMLFSPGSLWRLNELGWLRKLDVVSSVSGGSICNGVLATRWKDLEWTGDGADGVATNFVPLIVAPLRSMGGKNLDVFAGIEGLLSIFSTVFDKLIQRYDEHLFHQARLADIPSFERDKTPRFIFYATSLQTDSSARVEKKRMADHRIGEIPNPDHSVARAVCASSAFPPVLSPVEVEVDAALWREFPEVPVSFASRQDLKSRLLLADGGMYDNMGLEAVWDGCSTVLVSDAGAPLKIDAEPPTDWTRQAIRVLDIVTDQTRALRKRWLKQQSRSAQAAPSEDAVPPPKKAGSYWGITTHIDAYGLADALAKDNKSTRELQAVRTRLNESTSVEQGRLINWGYALADAGMRAHFIAGRPYPAPAWPVPAHSL
ncbi:patatin-like phospholipase family protein [Paucibacter sp. PLA-PC-4]|uniref:patatin-like phospholipase family protein n=1 Tax=Paucibacter sp. PLA-PC-4 TaxID=2993655 RepID=UPI00224944DC|nr:patatin-like phospholipase family protein [Paucibacter sp. PLA-PC-4]MCX2862257.1 patatin-like phospholipase family protein [Paucibacter sp. PLA-PC-4]